MQNIELVELSIVVHKAPVVSEITEFITELVINPLPTSNLEGQGLSFVRSLPFVQSGMVEPARAGIAQDH